MKNKFTLFSFLLLVVILISCKKEHAITPSANFKFKTHAADYSWDFEPDSARLEKGAMFTKRLNANTNNIVYTLAGWNNPDNISINFYLNTSVMALGTYKCETTISDPYVQGFAYINKIQYGIVTGDYTSVTITDISGNYASGYFYAVMHGLTSQTMEMRIYEGYFDHILIQK